MDQLTRKEIELLIESGFLLKGYIVETNGLLIDLIAIKQIVEKECTENEQMFFKKWVKEYDTNELANIFQISEQAVRKKKRTISKRIEKYLNE